MQDLNSLKQKITQMAHLALEMCQKTFQAFIGHDMDLLSEVLAKENKLNDFEKEITAGLIEFIRAASDAQEKSQATIYVDIVADLEIIGDYCGDILERVQVKIQEKLLFSEEAVQEYSELYHKTESALKEVVAVVEHENLSLVRDTGKQNHIDTLVDEYRRRHDQRLIDGVCSPLACNMFLNILDFTAAIYYHTKKIAKGLSKIKQ